MTPFSSQLHIHDEPAFSGRDEMNSLSGAMAHVCFASLDLLISPAYRLACYSAILCRPVISIRSHNEAPTRHILPTHPPIYSSTYRSICLPNYLPTRRRDLIPIHLSIYYFLLSFISGKMGERMRTNSAKLTHPTGMGGYGGGYVMLSIWEDVLYFAPAFPVVFIYLGRTYEYPTPINHTFSPD